MPGCRLDGRRRVALFKRVDAAFPSAPVYADRPLERPRYRGRSRHPEEHVARGGRDERGDDPLTPGCAVRGRTRGRSRTARGAEPAAGLGAPGDGSDAGLDAYVEEVDGRLSLAIGGAATEPSTRRRDRDLRSSLEGSEVAWRKGAQVLSVFETGPAHEAVPSLLLSVLQRSVRRTGGGWHLPQSERGILVRG
jgi:hypothetical protein